MRPHPFESDGAPFRVRPLASDGPIAVGYAALIAVSGYEDRCTHVARQSEGRLGEVWLFEYPKDVGAPSAETEAFWSAVPNKSAIDGTATQLEEKLVSLVGAQRSAHRVLSHLGDDGAIRVAVDISSMDRSLMASVVSAILNAGVVVTVDFLYSEGAFVTGLAGSEGTVTINGPIDEFVGWPKDPALPLLAIIGGGFESNLALAAVDTLEPSQTLVAMPEGRDTRFNQELLERNEHFLAGVTAAPNSYRVDQPYLTYRELRSTVALGLNGARIVIVAIGPKTFALAAMLVAAEFPDVTVWRVSAGRLRAAENRAPAGPIFGVSVQIGGIAG